MATITKRKRKKGTVYKAEIRLQGHPCLSQTFDRLSDAQRRVEETEGIIRSGGRANCYSYLACPLYGPAPC